jgi:hypothetical protein
MAQNLFARFISRRPNRERVPARCPSITFPVDDVTPATTFLSSVALDAFLARRFHREVFVLPKPKTSVVSSIEGCHPLIGAVGTAFAQHRPLVLSPDSIWLLIAQGFSHHLAQNAEELRGRLVRHQGKRELITAIQDLSLKEMRGAIADFSSQIRDASDPVLHETLICDFSTTTPEIRTASEVVLMDSYSHYFEYTMMSVCGIPKITLQGSVDDWQRISARIEVLATYGLEWWVARLRPILDQFVQTAMGKPSRPFWQAIYKPKHVYVSTSATGWIADLFPYLGDNPGNRRRSYVFKHVRDAWALPFEGGVSTKSFPSGLSSVPVRLINVSGIDRVDFVAGFFGVKQDSNGALSQLISWSVTAPKPATPVIIDP